jgi:hypothetical protein
MKKGRAGTMTHDYKRLGTTTLSAAMNVLDPDHAPPQTRLLPIRRRPPGCHQPLP